MKIINTISDLEAYVAECNPDIQMENYSVSQAELIEKVARKLKNVLYNQDWNFGQELPEINENEFYAMFEEY